MPRTPYTKPDENLSDAIPHKPAPRRNPCFADGCPMAGTMFPEGVGGERPGSCAFHYGINASDIPRVTRVLLDWACVSEEVRAARRALTGEYAADPKALDALFVTAWQRLRPLVSGWEAQLAPGNVHSSKGEDRGFREGYSDWSKKLERFLGGRVVEVLSIHRRSA